MIIGFVLLAAILLTAFFADSPNWAARPHKPQKTQKSVRQLLEERGWQDPHCN